MPSTLLFDIVKATKSLEAICGEVATRHAEQIVVEWVRIEGLGANGGSLKWRLRHAQSGRYHDDFFSSLSRRTLIVLSRIAEKPTLTQRELNEFTSELTSMLTVLMRGLRTGFSIVEMSRAEAAHRASSTE